MYQEESFGNYSCEIQKKGGDIKRRNINLTPQKDVLSKIEMTEEGRYYNFHIGKTKQLYCNILRVAGVRRYTSKDIIWTFQGRIVEGTNPSSVSEDRKRLKRRDTTAASILTLRNMDHNNEGTYKCFQGFSTFAVNLLMERSDILLKVSPDFETVNVNDSVEFSCEINSPGVTSNMIKWSFKPQKSKDEEALPKEVEIRPVSSLTSLLTITNVLKRHEGIYVCQVLSRKVFGSLFVESNIGSSVKPENVTQGSYPFVKCFCQWSNLNGNNHSKKESQMNGSRNSSLKMKQGVSYKDGIMYECDFNSTFEVQRQEIERLKNEGGKTSELIKKIQKNSTETERVLSKLTKEIKDLKQQNINTTKSHKKQKEDIILLKELLKEIKKCLYIKNVEEWIKWNKECPNIKVDFIWQINQISQKKGQGLYSKPFYSNNYKLRLYLYYNNNDYSFGYFIMKGDDDDKVEWPLKRNVTIFLMNQVLLISHRSETFKYDTFSDKGAFERPKKYENYAISKNIYKENISTAFFNDTLIISCLFSPL